MNQEIKAKFTCSECNSVFKRIYDLRKHVKKFHSEKLLNEIAPLKSSTKTYYFSCDVCQKNFSQKKHLTFHKKTHNEYSNNLSGSSTVSYRSFKKCPLCDFTNSSKIQLYTHFKDKHCIKMCTKIFEFSTKEDFQLWKNAIEQSTKSYYVKERGDKVYKSHKSISYICHRSGFYSRPEGDNKRHLKTQGSRKIGGFCPSTIELLVNSNNQYQVKFIDMHVGHSADLGHLNLTTVEREEIAAKIAMKIPFSHILDEVHDKISEDSLQRIHLLTRKDLNNITREFNLQSESVRHSNDAISIEAWVNDMQENQCVLFYKPQGVSSIENPQLKSDDFVFDSNKAEAETIYKNLQTTCSSDSLNKKGLQEKKEEMKKWFCKIVDTIQSDSQFQVLTKLIAPIEPTLRASVLKDSIDPNIILKQTKKNHHNKKITSQRRLFSTKKKNKKTKKIKNPSANERNLMAASPLNNFTQVS